MKLTPAQFGMAALLGRMPRHMSKVERIRHGRDYLVRLTRQDFGYDAMQWHDYLWESDAGGYRWCRRSREKWARHAEAAMGDPAWQQSLAELKL